MLRKKYSTYRVDDRIIDRIETIFSSSKYSGRGAGVNILIVVWEYFKMKIKLRKLKRQLSSNGVKGKNLKEVVEIIKSRIILNRRIGMLRSMQKLFKYWHVVHLPFAITMFVIMFVHIAVTIIFGYRWIF